jgi:hypothetical protein
LSWSLLLCLAKSKSYEALHLAVLFIILLFGLNVLSAHLVSVLPLMRETKIITCIYYNPIFTRS